jgi:hypothetical protein
MDPDAAAGKSSACGMKSTDHWPLDARHCLRVGSLSDKQVIEASADHFDVLVVQGNLAASAPQGIATWPLDKPIWIDPITYAFAASPAYLRSSSDKTKYKRTYVKLANEFGAPFDGALEQGRALVAADFEDVTASVDRVLGWQERVFAPDEFDVKYGAKPIAPALLTVPFFPLAVSDPAGNTEPDWMALNLQMLREAASLRSADRLAAGFLAELDVFDHPAFDQWLGAYGDVLTETGISHLLWWISDHDEVATSLQRASRMLSSFKTLADRGIYVHQAFGGSLSTFALASGLSSVAHGVNYWESKGWEPIASGGLPTARYFHPGLRERIRVPEAIAAIQDQIATASAFFEHVCGCDVCQDVIGNDPSNFGRFGEVNIRTRKTRGGGVAEFDSPTPEALFLTKRHYLHAKGAEVRLALEPGFSASDRLREDALFWASDLTRTRHLDRWALALAL